MNDKDDRFMHDDNRGTESDSDSRQQREQARRKAKETAEQAREEAARRADQQKGYVADQIGNISEAVRSMAMQFKDQEQISLADYTYRLSESTDQFAQRLRDNDSESLLRQVKDFSRREPALFIGGMAVGGFLLSRFFGSSERDANSNYDSQTDSEGYRGPSRDI